MRTHVRGISMMESEPRKRKMDDGGNAGDGWQRRRGEKQHEDQHGRQAREDEGEEEEKMEEFFALIRSMRDMRDRIMRRSLAPADQLPADRNADEHAQSKGASVGQVTAAWNPSFQPQDFLAGEAATAAPPSTRRREGGGGTGSIGHQAGKGNGKDEGGSGDLDLNLSL